MSAKENQVLNTICDYLTRKKYFFWRNNNTPIYDQRRQIWRKMPRYSIKGVSDIILIKDGFAIFLEIKNKTKQSDDQKIFEKKVKDAGAEYYIIKSIEDLIEIGL